MNWKPFVIACSIGVLSIPIRVVDANPVISGPADRKLVALTFDDGPSAKFTPIILDVLRGNHARATFFVIGSRIGKFPGLINEECREHHQVANHSFDHQIMTGFSDKRIHDELSHTQHAIEEVTRTQQPLMFRPPRGRINKRIVLVAEADHYTIVMWSVESGDWANPGVQAIVDTVLSHVKNGDIILFHDQGGNRRQTVDALKHIIPALQERGYSLVTVSDLIERRRRSNGATQQSAMRRAR